MMPHWAITMGLPKNFPSNLILNLWPQPWSYLDTMLTAINPCLRCNIIPTENHVQLTQQPKNKHFLDGFHMWLENKPSSWTAGPGSNLALQSCPQAMPCISFEFPRLHHRLQFLDLSYSSKRLTNVLVPLWSLNSMLKSLAYEASLNNEHTCSLTSHKMRHLVLKENTQNTLTDRKPLSVIGICRIL